MSNQIQKTMKSNLKALFCLTLTVFVFSQGFGQNAAKGTSDNLATASAVQCKFVDNNTNGICDNHEMKGKDGQCANYVDKDGNGICDNCPKNSNSGQGNGCPGYKNGTGNAQGMANCCGHRPCAGKGQGKCCGNQQVTPASTPSEPKK
jgi:hypothetical protein